jgi:hypothetical protein
MLLVKYSGMLSSVNDVENRQRLSADEYKTLRQLASRGAFFQSLLEWYDAHGFLTTKQYHRFVDAYKPIEGQQSLLEGAL